MDPEELTEEQKHMEQCTDRDCPCWQGEATGWHDLPE